MPKAVAQHNHRGGPDAIVLRAKISTQGRMDAERGKEAGRDHEAIHTFRLSAASEVVVFMAIESQRGKRLRGALPVEKIEVADGSPIHPHVLFVHSDELGGVRIGQRVEEHAIDDRKERSVRANPEGKGNNNNSGEGGILEQHAKGVADVLQQSGQDFTSYRRYIATLHQIRKLWVPHCPDFLRRLGTLIHSMRLSLMK